MVEMMVLLKNKNYNENYNEELKNAVEEYINTTRKGFNNGQNGKYSIRTINRQKDKDINKVKKYAELKLKNESGFSNYHFKILQDATLKKPQLNKHTFDTLRKMHLSSDEFESGHNDEVIEKLMTTGISVSFPKMEQQTNNKAAKNAIKGGILFGLAGAAVGGMIGSNDKQVIETTVRGEHGDLKVTDKGIVIKNSTETVHLEWENIERMSGNSIYLVEGTHIHFYNIPDNEIVASIINYRASHHRK